MRPPVASKVCGVASITLGADQVVVGTVSQRNGGLLIHAELVDVARRYQLWADHFERPLGHVTDLGQEIARQMQAALRLRLTSLEKRRLEKPSEYRPA